MIRLADMLAAARHLDRLPPSAFVRIGNDGQGCDPGDVKCEVVLADGLTVGSVIGDSWEDAARRLADAMGCDPLPTPPGAA